MICVIDMPPVQVVCYHIQYVSFSALFFIQGLYLLLKAPEIALWRRLLLGEGDGFTPGAISYGVDDMDVMDVSQRQR